MSAGTWLNIMLTAPVVCIALFAFAWCDVERKRLRAMDGRK